MVSVSIVDQNKHAELYTQLQMNRPYIAVYSEAYISIRQQELWTCKRIGYQFYCEEVSVVKHHSKYTCASGYILNFGPDIIKENCNFAYYFNKTDITVTVLDGGNRITLANWPDHKHIICNVNYVIPVEIPSHPYVLVNRSVLCNCGIEAENNSFGIISCMSQCRL